MDSTSFSAPQIRATEAIAPSFRRAFSLLAKPFRLGKFLKFTMLAGIAEISYLSMFIALPMQLIQLLVLGSMPQHSANQAAAGSDPKTQLVVGIVFAVFGGVMLLIMTVLLYFLCRLRLSLMDWILYGYESFREGWRKYGRASWRYFGLTLLLSVGVLLLTTLVAGPLVPLEMHTLKSIDPSRPESVGAIFNFMIPYMILMMGLSLVVSVVDGIARDFFLPPLGLADASIESCFRRFLQQLRSEPGDTSLYILLRTLLGFAFQWATSMLVLIPTIIIGLVAALIGVLLYRSLWSTGTGGQLLFVAYVITAVLLFVVLYLIAILAALGCGGVFKQTYALTWLSPRYPELTAIVYGSPAPTVPEKPAEPELPPTPPPDIAPPLLG